MPFFAPNKYTVVDGKDIFSGLPNMDRVIEVNEDVAQQVLRKQSQWIEVVKPVAQTERKVIHEVENSEVEIKQAKSPQAEVLKRGRPKTKNT